MKGKTYNMIILNMPLKRDFYIEMFDEQTFEGITYKFVEAKGLKLSFTATGASEEDAGKLMKKLVKESKFGKGIYFSVNVI